MTSTAYFKSDLDVLPEAIKAPVLIALNQWDEQLTKLNLNLPLSPELSASFIKVWVSSQYVSDSCIRYPELLIDLVTSKHLFTAYPHDRYVQQLAQLSVISEADLMQKLRYFRRQEMVRIAWRDLAGWAPLSETLAELSWLADACIQYALAFLYQEACELRGTPLLSDGSSQQIIVLGMGKLGAYELNYSSDIDLIFAYPENGVLSDRKATSYSEFFTRLCQRLVKVLDEITVDGFVFRTPNQLNEVVNLADFAGEKNVVLYFYPKDDTPGCTIEANDFTRLADEFAQLDTVVIGVSKDTCESHVDFINKFGLKVILLADTSGELCESYGVWREREKNGVKMMAIFRSTFIINKSGVLADVEYGVNHEGHAEAVLAKIKALTV